MNRLVFYFIILTSLFLGSCQTSSEQPSSQDSEYITSATQNKIDEPVSQEPVAIAESETSKNDVQINLSDPNDEVICKMQKPTGTKLTKKICRKRSEWEEHTKAIQNFVRDSHRRSAYGS